MAPLRTAPRFTRFTQRGNRDSGNHQQRPRRRGPLVKAGSTWGSVLSRRILDNDCPFRIALSAPLFGNPIDSGQLGFNHPPGFRWGKFGETASEWGQCFWAKPGDGGHQRSGQACGWFVNGQRAVPGSVLSSSTSGAGPFSRGHFSKTELWCRLFPRPESKRLCPAEQSGIDSKTIFQSKKSGKTRPIEA